jgi:cation diffusion facilitator CzcD-associated flavoprotein CzcO
MLDWVIIGGGPHGVHVAARLRAQMGIAADRLCIVDPNPQLLHRWTVNTARTGMRHLRSPVVHHLDIDPFSLRHYAGRSRRQLGLLAPPYERPALTLFNRHCEKVVTQWGLADAHIETRAEAFGVDDAAAWVETPKGRIEARNILLAISACEQPDWPSWAHDLKSANPDCVRHIFDASDPLAGLPRTKRVTVVGGGITAAQTAMRLVGKGHDSVTLLCRHPFREHQFDSDPGWIGPKNMRAFERESDFGRRRQMILEARHRGSLPPDVHRRLRQHIHRGRVQSLSGAIETTRRDAEGNLVLTGTMGTHATDVVLLATGFRRERPGGALIDKVASELNLPCASCGYPIVDAHLRWHPRIRVTGALAELELGPTARNLVGARAAAERIAGTTSPV